RISTFASQFHQVFAHLNDAPPHTSVAVHEDEAHPVSIVHQRGAQGEVLLLLKSAGETARQADVLLPNGMSLGVPLERRERAAWLLLNTNLGGAAQLDYTNLRPWAFLGRKLLVLFGPAGADGLVSLDEVPIHVPVPTGKEPRIERHEQIAIVVLSSEQIDATYIDENGLAIGAAGVDENDQPIRRADWTRLYRVDLDGNVSTEQLPQPPRPTAPRLTQWQHASLESITDGSDDAFEKIAGPASLEQLHCDYGYGWYRIGVGSAKSGRMIAPGAGDRLHIYSSGKLAGLLGSAPGATTDPVELKLSGDVVVLADNLGRPKIHQYVAEPKGLYDHLYTVRQARLAKPKVEPAQPADPFELSGYIPFARRGADHGARADSLVWHIKPSGRKPMLFDLGELPLPGIVFVNDTAVAYHHPRLFEGPTRLTLTAGEGGFTTGRNAIRLTPLESMPDKLNVEKHVRLYQTTGAVTGRGQWAFCRWQPPGDGAFDALPGTLPSRPTWFRARFNVKEANVPLWLEPRGMSKGQVFLNGRNVGRYFVATRDGKAVSPQKQYYLPEPWLRTDGANELMLFDEHGRDPRKCRLVYNRMGPYRSERRGR
ncbi:MAG: beta galactosidase jelly roll domain-containing protein, partial [Phycisphaeraceae bacterium]